ncbi:hypothetical protein P0Y35_16740 [Kiritimatiellaeota bacterium B1221]|nr:hypothetical protein [Kiritimatiellaeota bacterium B1221]
MSSRNSKTKGVFYTIFIVLLVTGITVFMSSYDLKLETHKQADTPKAFHTDTGHLETQKDRQFFWVKFAGRTYVIRLDKI